jgi:hypothetical protein
MEGIRGRTSGAASDERRSSITSVFDPAPLHSGSRSHGARAMTEDGFGGTAEIQNGKKRISLNRSLGGRFATKESHQC